VPIVHLSNVVKRYGKLTAVNDLSLEIEDGEIFGLLGPNGAGKTTTIEMIVGLRRPDAGTIRVAGLDPTHDSSQLNEIIGVQLESAPLYPLLNVREIFYHFGRYYRHRRSVNEMIELMSLQEKETSRFEHLSRGQRQRLALGLALINDPRIIFLDEPTSGLDPQGRKHIWEIIERERASRTVLLTTHYMEEAEAICDRVGIIDHGELIALGAPATLVAEYDLESRIEFDLPPGIAAACLAEIPRVRHVSEHNGQVVIYTDDSFFVLSEIVDMLRRDQRSVNYLSVRPGNLEDVFLKLTGRNLRE
jgi:ABC-2 type transport system ATP-binding protein